MSRFSSVLLLCIIAFSITTHAQSGSRWGSGIDFTKRTADREKNRWSLSDWMEMKNRNQMMDMWLSLNSPSPFEFSIAGSYNNFKTKTSPLTSESSHNSFKGEASAYAQLVGLTGEYENNTEENFSDFTGMFNFRLFGNSIQSTFLTLHYGIKTRDGQGDKLEQQFGQASLQVYLTKYFGLEGKYRKYLPKSHDVLGDVNSELVEGGLFIDFKAIRVFGTWFQHKDKTKIPAATDDSITDRTGIRSGIKIFF